MQTRGVIGVLALCLAVPAAAAAQDDPEYVLDDVPESTAAPEDPEASPWTLDLKIGGTVNVSDNRSVVGQPDGSSVTLGLTADFASALVEGDHEWRSTVSILERFSLTPVIPTFVKTADLLDIETIYLYRFIDWLGAYGRVGFEMPFFEGHQNEAAPKDFRINYLDGDSALVNTDRLLLTGWASPITLKESLGIFARPLDDKELNLEIRLGFGGRHAFTAGSLVVDDDGATPETEVRELDSIHSAGGELIVSLWGDVLDGKASYRLEAEAMMPFIDDLPASDDRNPAELTNLDLLAKLVFKLVDWASVDYEFKLKREPAVVDAWQVQNNLLLTISVDVL